MSTSIWDTEVQAILDGAKLQTSRSIPFDELGPLEMVAWRLGMAPCAGFVAALSSEQEHNLVQRALELLGPHPAPIVRRVILIAAERPR